MNNKLSLKIFWFQALWKPPFENKKNFWINCVCIKAFVSWYTHKGAFAFICIHCIPKKASASLHTYKGTLASWHIPKGAFAFIAYLKGYLHHCIPTRVHSHYCMHHKDIRITAYLQVNIYIMTYIHEHLHHDIPTRGYLHHGIPTWAFASWHAH